MTKRNTSDEQVERNQSLSTHEEFGKTMTKLLRGSQEMRRQEKLEKERQQSPEKR